MPTLECLLVAKYRETLKGTLKNIVCQASVYCRLAVETPFGGRLVQIWVVFCILMLLLLLFLLLSYPVLGHSCTALCSWHGICMGRW